MKQRTAILLAALYAMVTTYATTWELVVDVSSKHLTTTNAVAIREIVPVEIIHLGGTTPANLWMQILDREGNIMATAGAFSAITNVTAALTNIVGTTTNITVPATSINATGTVNLSTIPLTNYFAGMPATTVRAFTLVVADTNLVRVLCNDSVQIQNNPFQPGMPDPVPVDQWYWSQWIANAMTNMISTNATPDLVARTAANNASNLAERALANNVATSNSIPSLSGYALQASLQSTGTFAQVQNRATSNSIAGAVSGYAYPLTGNPSNFLTSAGGGTAAVTIPDTGILKLPLTYAEGGSAFNPAILAAGATGASNQFNGFGYGKSYMLDTTNFVCAYTEGYYISNTSVTGSIVVATFDLRGGLVSKVYVDKARAPYLNGWNYANLFRTAQTNWLISYNESYQTNAVIARSTDRVNWTTVTNMPATAFPTNLFYTSIGCGQMAQVGNTILLPCYSLSADANPAYSCFIMASTNDGAAWFTWSTLTTGASSPTLCYNEFSLLALPSGTLQAYVRNSATGTTYKGNASLATSTDTGKTWGALSMILPLRNGNGVAQLASGRVVIAGRDSALNKALGGASAGSTVVYGSGDNGATWDAGTIIDHGVSWCASLLDAGNGNIGIIYGNDWLTNGSIGGATLRLAYVREGYGASPLGPEAGWMKLPSVAFAGGVLDAPYGWDYATGHWSNDVAAAGGRFGGYMSWSSIAVGGGIVSNTGSQVNYNQAALAGGIVLNGINAEADSAGIVQNNNAHADSQGNVSGASSHADSGGTVGSGGYWAHGNSGGTAGGYMTFGAAGGVAQSNYSAAIGLGAVAGVTNSVAITGTGGIMLTGPVTINGTNLDAQLAGKLGTNGNALTASYATWALTSGTSTQALNATAANIAGSISNQGTMALRSTNDFALAATTTFTNLQWIGTQALTNGAITNYFFIHMPNGTNYNYPMYP